MPCLCIHLYSVSTGQLWALMGEMDKRAHSGWAAKAPTQCVTTTRMAVIWWLKYMDGKTAYF